MKKYLLVLICVILAVGVGLAISSCDNLEDWVEIYVFNESEFNISVKIEKRTYNSDREDYDITTEHTQSNIPPGERSRYNGASGSFKVTVSGNSTNWYYPRGAGTGTGSSAFTDMDTEFVLVFDGDQLKKGENK